MSRAAYSVLELLVCLALLLLFCGVGAPALLASRDAVLADSAAAYLSSQLQGARMEALKRRSNVAIRFEAIGDAVLLAAYLDGNGNGVRAGEIESGVDSLLRPREGLGERFAGVEFGFEDGVPDVDGEETLTNPDPIRVGRSRMLSFSATGTSSTGTVYLRGRGHHQLAVRVLGATGRVRCLGFDFAASTWLPR